MSRPLEHEYSLATPHTVEPSEIAEAEVALADWNAREAAEPVDSDAWLFSVRMASNIDGWIWAARETGLTRRSFARMLIVAAERSRVAA